MRLRRPCKNPKDKDHEDERLAIVDIAKHRNGPIGEAIMDFDAQFTRFTDRDLSKRNSGYNPNEEPEN